MSEIEVEPEVEVDLDEQAIEMLASAYYWEIEQGFKLKSKAAQKAYSMAVAEYAAMKTSRTLHIPTAEELKSVEGK